MLYSFCLFVLKRAFYGLRNLWIVNVHNKRINIPARLATNINKPYFNIFQMSTLQVSYEFQMSLTSRSFLVRQKHPVPPLRVHFSECCPMAATWDNSRISWFDGIIMIDYSIWIYMYISIYHIYISTIMYYDHTKCMICMAYISWHMVFPSFSICLFMLLFWSQ